MTWFEIANWLADQMGTDYASLAYHCGSVDPFVIVAKLTAHTSTWFCYYSIGISGAAFIFRGWVGGWTRDNYGLAIARFFDPQLIVLVFGFIFFCGNGHGAELLRMIGKMTARPEAAAHLLTAAISIATIFYSVWRMARVRRR